MENPREKVPQVVNAEKAKEDPLFKLQYMGYFLAGLDSSRKDLSIADFVNIAKFRICEERNLLMKDPIWEQYNTNEEILVEYYAIMYRKDEGARSNFEAILAGFNKTDLDWMDEQIKKNKNAVEAHRQALQKAEAEIGDNEIKFEPEGE